MQAAYANGLLADWCEQGKPQAVANISSGTCAKGSLLQEYVDSLAAPAVEQVCKGPPCLNIFTLVEEMLTICMHACKVSSTENVCQSDSSHSSPLMQCVCASAREGW